MKIYTKKGDLGETSLIGGRRVYKSHLRIECYGTVDELNSCLGLLLSLPVKDKKARNTLIHIQDRLFVIGSLLAADPKSSRMTLPELLEKDIVFLEKEIDRMTAGLLPLKSFILPGGDFSASWCHVARCVCRRVERLAVELSCKEKVENKIVPYLNRLSDYLFVLARKINADQKIADVLWRPKRTKCE